MNNKKFILGAVWTVGLLAVGVGGYCYFSGGAGQGGSAAWSNAAALVDRSWNEMVGLPTSSSTPVDVPDASDDDSDGSVASAQSVQPAAPAPVEPPPVYSIADDGSDSVSVPPTTATPAPAQSSSSQSSTVSTATPPPLPTVSYSAPSSSSAVAQAFAATTTPAIAATASTSSVATTTANVQAISSEEPTSTQQTTTVATPTPPPAATSSTSAAPAQISAPASIDHLVIVQVQIVGAASANDFVKIFNPTGAVVDLTGWKLHKKSSTGTDYSLKTFPTGETIASGEYLTWANSENGFADSIGADVSSTETLSADNSVALMDPSDAVIDAVAWGTGTSQYVEGDAYPTDPTANQVLTRKSANGGVVDTDDNANDFTLQ